MGLADGRMIRLLVPWLVLTAGMAIAQQPVPSDPPPPPDATRLVIGQGWAVVTETHTRSLRRLRETLRFDLDADADPATLLIRERRNRVAVVGWRMADGAEVSPTDRTDRLQIYPPPSVPNHRMTGSRLREQALVEVEASVPGEYRFTVSYRMTNWSWRAHYQMSVRGDIQNPGSPISLDIEGWANIVRSGSRGFDAASVVLVGSEEDLLKRRRDHAGILMLDPYSPLADAWREPAPEPVMERAYPLERPVLLDPRQPTQVQLIHARRVRAERLYGVRYDQIPSDVRGPGAPFSQYLVFRNDRDVGEGKALPPGRSVIYLGSPRSLVHRQGDFGHTEPGADVRLDMGPADQLLVKRQSQGELESAAGFFEARWSLRIDNSFEAPVAVEIVESPPLALTWTLSRSTHNYILEQQRVVFQFDVAGDQRDSVEYAVRYRLPTF